MEGYKKLCCEIFKNRVIYFSSHKTRVIPLGNFENGIRVPKWSLDYYGMHGYMWLITEENRIR